MGQATQGRCTTGATLGLSDFGFYGQGIKILHNLKTIQTSRRNFSPNCRVNHRLQFRSICSVGIYYRLKVIVAKPDPSKRNEPSQGKDQDQIADCCQARYWQQLSLVGAC